MARPCRLQAEHCLYHITSRGDDRKQIFVNHSDYQKFLCYLKTVKDKFQVYVYAYCLMGNHYHLLLETIQPNLSSVMQYLNASYTAYYNAKHKRCGHLFQGRFKSVIVEVDSYLSELTRYIHLNPVRAKIVDRPEKYRWSSYNSYLSNQLSDIIDICMVRRLLGMNGPEYVKFVLSGMNNIMVDPLKKVYAGCILGGEKFIKDNLARLKGEVESRNFAHKRELKNILEPQEIIKVVAHYFKEDPWQMCKSLKRPMTAKKTAIYLLRKKTGLTNAQIGEMFDMKFAAVSKAALSFEREMGTNKVLREAVDCIISKVEA